MKFILLLATGLFIFIINAPSFAIDKGGCLTCHRYPGLVAQEKPGEFLALHIDEETYRKTPHGNIDCKKCHMHIRTVPHSGEKRVSCTYECHLDDKEKIMDMYNSTYIVHEKEAFSITRLENRSSCRVCHPLYPHSKNTLVRAFINMHAGFIFCKVCHKRIDEMKEKASCSNCHNIEVRTTYDWAKPETAEFSLRPYGKYYMRKRGPGQNGGIKEYVSGLLKKTSPDNGKTDKDNKIEYSIRRIALFSEAEGRKKRNLMNLRDTAVATDFKAHESSIAPPEKERMLKFFHREVEKKDISIMCNECHTQNSMLDFRKLGYDEKKVSKLKSLNVKGLITNYETFHFPEFLDIN